MSKNFKKIIAIAFVVGALGGLTEYFSPSIKVDEWMFFESRESVEASALAPIIEAKGAILIDAKSGNTIYEKDADKRLYPASTTKIMTTLVALEIMEEIDASLDSKVIIPKEAVGVEGSSIYLKEGERITIEELLYGVMLRSGNDAATAIGIALGGDLDTFIKKMNEKAANLGCKNTKFINPSGLFNKEHYTTARELSRISREAMKNELFREIAKTKVWRGKDSDRTFENKNKTVTQYEGATGIKIGYTKKSGRTLVASAKRGEMELIAVVLDDPNWFDDAYKLLDYGFERMGNDVKGDFNGV